MQIQKLLPSEFERINRLLVENYGYFHGHARFRLSWAPDVIEKRQRTHTNEGLLLLTPVIEELPKYRQYIGDKYIIEMFSYIGDNPELGINEVNYEPFYTFEDRNREFLIPKWSACKVIIDNMLELAGVKRAAKYNTTNEQEREALIKRVDEIEEALYGNESKIGDALARDTAVGYGTRQRNDSFSPEQKIQQAMKQER